MWVSWSGYIVFEDYVNTTDGTRNVTKARQATSHPDWMKANVVESKDREFMTVLVTPATKFAKMPWFTRGDCLIGGLMTSVGLPPTRCKQCGSYDQATTSKVISYGKRSL